MAEFQEIDVEQIMERIRENIRRRRKVTEGGTPSLGPVTPSDGNAIADFALLHSGYDVYNVRFTSHRKLLGPAVVLIKKVLRNLLTPILTRQVSYNAANTRVVSSMKEQLAESVVQLRGEMGQQQARLREDLLVIQARELRAVTERMDALDRGERDLAERVARAERKLRRILYALTEGGEEAREAGLVLSEAPRRLLEPGFDYAGFEERFRGSEEAIKGRQRGYAEHFKGQDDVLDVGCGRGEFLEVLRDAGVRARGVDIDLDMVLHCREKGLEVTHDDAFTYLKFLPDESLGGVFAAQVIEHLDSGDIIRLVTLAHRKLRPGGILVLETLNPESLLVHYRWFWMDLTHTRLVHPETLKFLLESVGFRHVEWRVLPSADALERIPPLDIREASAPALQRFNAATERLNNLLCGSSDYAIVGKK